AALLAETQGLHGLVDVSEGRVERVVRALVGHTVLFATDDADLHLEDGVDRLHTGKELLGDLDVLCEGNGRAVPHVGLEDRVAAGLDLFFGCRDERLDEAGKGILRAVIGVQRDGDRVALGDLCDVAGEGEGAGGASLDRVTGEVVGTAGGDLD